jgi:hypothetical protein
MATLRKAGRCAAQGPAIVLPPTGGLKTFSSQPGLRHSATGPSAGADVFQNVTGILAGREKTLYPFTRVVIFLFLGPHATSHAIHAS